ncbi:MAG: homoserine O-acetyltransferase [Planctomycetota bacterium]|jgi:homoserine O-acetyltransferase|nr:homoserine O-acetyltransferase [Planctomycetota bacterium]
MAENKAVHGTNGPESPGSVGWTSPERLRLAGPDRPFRLECGAELTEVEVEYEAYGRLSPDRDNVILVEHALSGDAHAAGWDRQAGEETVSGRFKARREGYSPPRGYRHRKPGWWDTMIGPGKPIDTGRFFVVCSNVLGSCYGTTGPASVNPATGEPYALSFPVVTVEDWVRLQALLLDSLGVDRLYAVIGGSLGGQQALEWALRYPERVEKAIILAASPKLSVQGVAFNAVARYSIMNDPNFNGGGYYRLAPPEHGLAAARMLAHITYLSNEGMNLKFGRRLRNKDKPDFGFDVEFEVESYLNHQGKIFVERFDANSYLYITRAMDYYDAAERWGGGDLVAACDRLRSEILVSSFSSDWLYTPDGCRQLVHAVCRSGRPVTYADIPSQYGHDAFLVETDRVGKLLRGALKRRAKGRPGASC